MRLYRKASDRTGAARSHVSKVRIRPVIVSGGAGTRVWPVSRVAYPKQLLALTASETMLQTTARRVTGDAFHPIIGVGDEEHRFFLKDQLEELGAGPEAI